MINRWFEAASFQVVTGWDHSLQSHFLEIYQCDHPDLDPRSSHRVFDHPSMTVEQIADTLRSYGITAPKTLVADLQRDTLSDRGDFDVHYDTETGTASIQAEYGDCPYNDALDFGIRYPDEAARTSYDLEVLYPRDFGDESAAPSPVIEQSELREVVDRVREWFSRSQDPRMDL